MMCFFANQGSLCVSCELDGEDESEPDGNDKNAPLIILIKLSRQLGLPMGVVSTYPWQLLPDGGVQVLVPVVALPVPCDELTGSRLASFADAAAVRDVA